MSSEPNNHTDGWRKIEELFHAAVELPPEQRGSFLNEDRRGVIDNMAKHIGELGLRTNSPTPFSLAILSIGSL